MLYVLSPRPPKTTAARARGTGRTQQSDPHRRQGFGSSLLPRLNAAGVPPAGWPWARRLTPRRGPPTPAGRPAGLRRRRRSGDQITTLSLRPAPRPAPGGLPRTRRQPPPQLAARHPRHPPATRPQWGLRPLVPAAAGAVKECLCSAHPRCRPRRPPRSYRVAGAAVTHGNGAYGCWQTGTAAAAWHSRPGAVVGEQQTPQGAPPARHWRGGPPGWRARSCGPAGSGPRPAPAASVASSAASAGAARPVPWV